MLRETLGWLIPAGPRVGKFTVAPDTCSITLKTLFDVGQYPGTPTQMHALAVAFFPVLPVSSTLSSRNAVLLLQRPCCRVLSGKRCTCTPHRMLSVGLKHAGVLPGVFE